MFDPFKMNEADEKPNAAPTSSSNSPYQQAQFIFDLNEMDEFGMEFDTQLHDSTTTPDQWNTTDQIDITPKQPFFIPLPKHKRRTTQPVTKPKPVLQSRKNSKLHEEIFKVRTNRKIPSNHPRAPPPEEGSEDERFYNACSDKTFVLNPCSMGFIPSKYWPDENIPFGDIVADFFQRKNNVNCRFSHKLFNAIQISKNFPDLKFFSGVEWLGSKVLKVNKNQFARLLGIHSIDGSLFHQQGNFTTHGFVEISEEEASKIVGEDIGRIDFDKVKLLIHQNGVFVRDVTEDQLNQCKWVSTKKRDLYDQDDGALNDSNFVV